MNINVCRNIDIMDFPQTIDHHNCIDQLWDISESLAARGATLHTIALNTKELNGDVRQRLMKMAKLGGGGFNFAVSIKQFHTKVEQLLAMSINAVCPPSKFRILPCTGVKLRFATLLEHVEQKQEGDDLANLEFTIPALRSQDRKIIYFRAVMNHPYPAGELIRVFEYEQSPELLSSTDDAHSSIPSAPVEVFRRALDRGLNPDMRIFILLHTLESKLEHALLKSTTENNIEKFKMLAQKALIDCRTKLDSELARNPRRDEVNEFISRFMTTLDETDTVEDPSIFFSTLYAEMRTRR